MKIIQSIQNIPIIERKQPLLRFNEDELKVFILDNIFQNNPNEWIDEYPQFQIEVLSNHLTNTVEVVVYQQP